MRESRKILVCGARDYADRERLYQVLDQLAPTMVIHGAATGADSLAGAWARERGVIEIRFPANWRLGPQAGTLRNTRMLYESKPHMIVAFPPGPSGTYDMVSQALAARVPVHYVDWEDYRHVS